MFWTIVIATGAGFCQFVGSLLGWRMTTHPIDPNNPHKKRKMLIYDGAFILAGTCGIILIILMASRAPIEHAHLDVQAGPINSTDTWASGTADHKAGFLVVGQPLEFNIWFTNVGPGVATNVGTRQRSFIEPDMSTPSEDDALEEFKKRKSPEPQVGGAILDKGAINFSTAPGVILAPEDYDNLVYGRRVVYVVAEIPYRDDSGQHVRHYCAVLQPPQSGGTMIWHFCDSYNDED